MVLGPAPHVGVVGEQDHLGLPGNGQQGVEYGHRARRVTSAQRIVQQEGTGFPRLREVPRERQPQQEVHLLGGAVGEEVGAPEVTVGTPHFHGEGRRVDAAVHVTPTRHPGQPGEHRLAQHLGDIAVHPELRSREKVDGRREGRVKARDLALAALGLGEALLRVRHVRQVALPLLECPEFPLQGLPLPSFEPFE